MKKELWERELQCFTPLKVSITYLHEIVIDNVSLRKDILYQLIPLIYVDFQSRGKQESVGHTTITQTVRYVSDVRSYHVNIANSTEI